MKRVPRKLKKAISKVTISYDICTLPIDVGMTLDKMIYIFKSTGVVLYTTYKEGEKPQMFPKSKRIKIREYGGEE